MFFVWWLRGQTNISPTEKYAFEIDSLLREWSQSLKESVRDFSGAVEGTFRDLRSFFAKPGQGRFSTLWVWIETAATKRQFGKAVPSGVNNFSKR